MFEYYGNIYVCYPGVGADVPLVSIFFSKLLIFSPTVHYPGVEADVLLVSISFQNHRYSVLQDVPFE